MVFEPMNVPTLPTKRLICRAIFVALCVSAGTAGASEAPPNQGDINALRARLVTARQALERAHDSSSEPEGNALRAKIVRAEEAVIAYERALQRSKIQHAGDSKPLYFAGIALVADDASGVGVADDFLIPVVLLAIWVQHLRNRPVVSPPPEELADAWRDVMQRLADIALAVKALQMSYIPPLETLPAFPEAVRVKPKSSNAAGTRRPRWKLPDGSILEWDGLVGTVEP